MKLKNCISDFYLGSIFFLTALAGTAGANETTQIFQIDEGCIDVDALNPTRALVYTKAEYSEITNDLTSNHALLKLRSSQIGFSIYSGGQICRFIWDAASTREKDSPNHLKFITKLETELLTELNQRISETFSRWDLATVDWAHFIPSSGRLAEGERLLEIQSRDPAFEQYSYFLLCGNQPTPEFFRQENGHLRVQKTEAILIRENSVVPYLIQIAEMMMDSPEQSFSEQVKLCAVE